MTHKGVEWTRSRNNGWNIDKGFKTNRWVEYVYEKKNNKLGSVRIRKVVLENRKLPRALSDAQCGM